MERTLRNIPLLRSLVRRGGDPKIGVTFEQILPKFHDPISGLHTPEPNYLADTVLFPFSSKVSLLLQSLGAEIVEKMQHTVSGKDFLLVKLPCEITPDSLRKPRPFEFTGENTGNVVKLLFTRDNRLLAFASGFHGEAIGTVGRSWDDIAEYINEAGRVIKLPDNIVYIDGISQVRNRFEQYTELVVGGCNQIGDFDYHTRAMSDFSRTKGIVNAPISEKAKRFSDYLEPLKTSASDLAKKRLQTVAESILVPDPIATNTGSESLEGKSGISV